MGDDVVQLACDARLFLGGRAPRLGLAFALEPRRLLLQLLQVGPARAQAVAEQPGGGGEENPSEAVAGLAVRDVRGAADGDRQEGDRSGGGTARGSQRVQRDRQLEGKRTAAGSGRHDHQAGDEGDDRHRMLPALEQGDVAATVRTSSVGGVRPVPRHDGRFGEQ